MIFFGNDKVDGYPEPKVTYTTYREPYITKIDVTIDRTLINSIKYLGDHLSEYKDAETLTAATKAIARLVKAYRG